MAGLTSDRPASHEETGRSPGRARVPALVRLPLTMADFRRRGFRLDRPDKRAVLETHARSFISGFNIAAARWPAVHAALREVPAEERGFAYEGAGMYAAARDLARTGARSLEALLRGPGDSYVHLVHVGAGWLPAALRVPLPGRLPATPLLRWLARDGAGFAETYFGGPAAAVRRARRTDTPQWRIRLGGTGRALWFVHSGDVAALAEFVDGLPAPARPHLWSGVGLAAAYAGTATRAELDLLAAASWEHVVHLAQGVVFAVAARRRSGCVPGHTELACGHLLSADVDVVDKWAEVAAHDLQGRRDAAAYLRWQAGVRQLAGERL